MVKNKLSVGDVMEAIRNINYVMGVLDCAEVDAEAKDTAHTVLDSAEDFLLGLIFEEDE